MPASFYRQHVRQVVHHPAEVVDTVGVGDEAVPGLALGHLLGATVVVADVRTQSTISSPSSCRTIRKAPCAEGWFGPRLRNM
jgi:sugar/nucleoside kinase (ribokinase family)